MKKINYLIYTILAFLMLSLCTFLFSELYSPIKRNSLKNIDLNFKDYQKTLKKLKIKEKELREWNSVRSIYRDGKEKYFMKFSEFSKFRNDLKTVIRKLGLNEFGLKVGYRKILKGEFIRSSIAFKISGNYKNIKRLIFEILRSDKIVFIRKINLSKKSGNIISGNFIMEVILVP